MFSCAGQRRETAFGDRSCHSQRAYLTKVIQEFVCRHTLREPAAGPSVIAGATVKVVPSGQQQDRTGSPSIPHLELSAFQPCKLALALSVEVRG